MAVFGIAFLDEEKGEKQFLPIIGEDHLAAMPYEIILEGKKATMLHGRYRLALHWPELTMGTFMKIRNTPGDIKDAFEAKKAASKDFAKNPRAQLNFIYKRSLHYEKAHLLLPIYKAYE